jgi:hypothetical protein
MQFVGRLVNNNLLKKAKLLKPNKATKSFIKFVFVITLYFSNEFLLNVGAYLQNFLE